MMLHSVCFFQLNKFNVFHSRYWDAYGFPRASRRCSCRRQSNHGQPSAHGRWTSWRRSCDLQSPRSARYHFWTTMYIFQNWWIFACRVNHGFAPAPVFMAVWRIAHAARRPRGRRSYGAHGHGWPRNLPRQGRQSGHCGGHEHRQLVVILQRLPVNLSIGGICVFLILSTHAFVLFSLRLGLNKIVS